MHYGIDSSNLNIRLARIQEISPILHLADDTWRTRRFNLITGEISHIGDFSCNMFNKEMTGFFNFNRIDGHDCTL